MRALKTLFWCLLVSLALLQVTQAKTDYAYVANYSGGTVSVINTSNNTVTKTVNVGTNPFAVAVDQAGKNVYVTNYGSGNVSMISTTTNAVVATIPVGTGPAGVVVAPSGKTAYVANLNSGQPSGSVSVINTGTKKVTATITVQGEPQGMAILPDGAFLYVGNYSSDTVSVISTVTNAVVATVNVGTSPTWLANSPDGSTVYVTNAGSSSVSVIRTADNSIVDTINIATGTPYGDAVSPDGHWLYVVTPGTVNVIATSTQTLAATIPVTGGAFYTIPSFSQDSAFAYVTGGNGTVTVTVINTATQTVAATVTVGSGPAGVAVMGTMKVTTVVGGYVGDKGPATSATLNTPYSSVLDSSGNLYISDFYGDRIRKVATSGTITTYAGNGICAYNGDNIKVSLATVCVPNQLLFDSAGDLVFADGGNRRIRKITKAGIISTIAGNGVFGYTGDGGPALSAEIGQPYSMTYDASGNLFFAQVGNCVVRKIDTSGNISTVAGTGTCGYNGDGIPATTAQLNLPRGVAFDTSGNLYIGDTQNHRVRKVDTTGTISTYAGNGQPGYIQDGVLATTTPVGSPVGLQVVNGLLYISNGGDARVRTVNLSTQIINTYAGSFYGYDGDGNPLLSTRFTGPRSMEFDGSGNPIFNDAYNNRVRKATSGIVNTIAGGFIGDGNKATSAALNSPEALTLDKSGNFYIADYDSNRVRKVSGGTITTIAGTGINGYTGDNGPATSAQLNGPEGVTLDSKGNIYIADTDNGVIRIVSGGTITTFAANANFSYLLQMATDSSNNIYVADAGACVVWKITPGGTVSIAAGVLFTCGYNGDGIAATTADLNTPYAVAFDSHGNLYIADNGNARLRAVSTSGIISTVAGNGTCGDTGDGGSATAAEVCPNSVAIDSKGNIYMADFSFDVIRKISGGTITTFAGSGFGFDGDGLWPLYTSFGDAVAVAVDSKGAVYELDDVNNRVRKIE